MSMPNSPEHGRGSASHPRSDISRIILAGFMGAGKTTVGRLLAQRMRWKFLDIDNCLEEKTGKHARELFAELGETGFRQLESEMLANCLERTNAVVATGGAVIDRVENQTMLKGSKGSLIIFLDAPFEALIERCEMQEQKERATFRPLLRDKPVARARFATRRQLYAALAHFTVEVAERTPDAVLQSILEAMTTKGRETTEDPA
jgi:shikimate kinase